MQWTELYLRILLTKLNKNLLLEVREGGKHTGLASVVQIMGFKP